MRLAELALLLLGFAGVAFVEVAGFATVVLVFGELFEAEAFAVVDDVAFAEVVLGFAEVAELGFVPTLGLVFFSICVSPFKKIL